MSDQRLIPSTPALSKRSYAAPLSFVGATSRIVAWIGKVGARGPAMAVLAWTSGIVLLALAYSFIVCWYTIIFGFFGLFMVPYRLVRRSQRKSRHLQQAQLATMQQIMVAQADVLSRRTSKSPPKLPPS